MTVAVSLEHIMGGMDRGGWMGGMDGGVPMSDVDYMKW